MRIFKMLSLFIFLTCKIFFAATNLSTSNVYDTNLTVSWIPQGIGFIDIYRYDTNESNISHLATLSQGSNTYVTYDMTPHTTYTIIVSENDMNTTISETTTHIWDAIMSECATGEKIKPTKAQLQAISSFSCSYSGYADINCICDINNTTKINMRGNYIKQNIPTCIGDLTALQELDFSGNLMQGSIPTQITTLSNLKKLDLSNNRFTKLPTGIENMSSLEELHVSFNRLTQKIPPELGDMWWLEKLYLQGNRLFGEIPPELGDMWSLQKLRLNQNNLRGVIPVSFVDLNLTQPNGLGLHENCRIELPIDNIETNETNETAVVLDWLDSKASLYRGYTGMQQTGGHCWSPAMVSIITMYLLDSNDTNTTP